MRTKHDLPSHIAISSESSMALSLYHLLKNRRGGLHQPPRRFACAGDPDFHALDGRIVFVTPRAIGLEALAISATANGAGSGWLVHSLEEMALVGLAPGVFTRDEIARIAAGVK